MAWAAVLVGGVGAALLAAPAVSSADPGTHGAEQRTAPGGASQAQAARDIASPAARPGTRRPEAAPPAAGGSPSRFPSHSSKPGIAAPLAGQVASSAASVRPSTLRPAPVRTAAPTPVASASATPPASPPPVTVDDYLGTWYEQGSVKLPFEWGMVNITANYSRKPDGTIRVLNSGKLFGPGGPAVNVVGNAVPVNATNNRLAVNFYVNVIKGPPGNYWILDHAPDYSWSIVSDPTHFTGWILTRDAALPAGQYQDLVKQARALGVWGPITKTKQQYPAG